MAEYNDIFERIMNLAEEDEDYMDLVGLVAYAIYKQEKATWAAAEQEKLGGQIVGRDKLNAYSNTFNTDDSLQKYFFLAQSYLITFAEGYIEESKSEFKREALEGTVNSKIDDLDRNLKNVFSFKNMIVSGIVGGISFTILVVIIYLFTNAPTVIEAVEAFKK